MSFDKRKTRSYKNTSCLHTKNTFSTSIPFLSLLIAIPLTLYPDGKETEQLSKKSTKFLQVCAYIRSKKRKNIKNIHVYLPSSSLLLPILFLFFLFLLSYFCYILHFSSTSSASYLTSSPSHLTFLSYYKLPKLLNTQQHNFPNNEKTKRPKKKFWTKLFFVDCIIKLIKSFRTRSNLTKKHFSSKNVKFRNFFQLIFSKTFKIDYFLP